MTVLINEDKPFGSYDSKKALRKIGAEGNFLKVVKSYVEHRWCRTSRGNLRRVPLKAKNRTTMLIGKRQQGGQNEATANTGSFYTSNRRQHISSFRTSTGSAPKGARTPTTVADQPPRQDHRAARGSAATSERHHFWEGGALERGWVPFHTG